MFFHAQEDDTWNKLFILKSIKIRLKICDKVEMKIGPIRQQSYLQFLCLQM